MKLMASSRTKDNQNLCFKPNTIPETAGDRFTPESCIDRSCVGGADHTTVDFLLPASFGSATVSCCRTASVDLMERKQVHLHKSPAGSIALAVYAVTYEISGSTSRSSRCVSIFNRTLKSLEQRLLQD